MYCIRHVTNDLFWIGANDFKSPLFEAVHPISRGMSYNSYLLLDEKTVLFDTVDRGVQTQFFENMNYVLGDRKLDYIFVHHMEPDHAATLGDLMLRHPEATIVCNGKIFNMIRQFHCTEPKNIMLVNEGDTISTGKHKFTFYNAPMVHWPEVMVSYDSTDKLLFSADAFGTFGTLNGHIFADELDFEHDILDEARRYYTNIVGKYGPQVTALLKKASSLDIEMILPLHGPVWRKDLHLIIDKYAKWAAYEPEENGVLIAFSSVYGDTENAVNILACRLAEKGIKVDMYDVSVTDDSYVLSECFRYSHLVFATTTYNNGIFIAMDNFLRDLAHHNLQNRKVALIQNGSWAPTSGKLMADILHDMKNMEVLNTPITLKSSLAIGQEIEINALADLLEASVNGEEEFKQEEEATESGRFICQICGYVYEGDTLPEDFKCPVCGKPASDFKQAASETKEEEKPRGYICKVCGFIYESEDLPEDFKCPICGRPASDFKPVE